MHSIQFKNWQIIFHLNWQLLKAALAFVGRDARERTFWKVSLLSVAYLDSIFKRFHETNVNLSLQLIENKALLVNSYVDEVHCP